jgi:exodeoxyribonuclease VII large subunit
MPAFFFSFSATVWPVMVFARPPTDKIPPMTAPALPTGASGQPRQVLSVSQLNREARAVLEGHFPLLWVEGEISNLARPGSGHLYFSLKDEHAQARCAMFRVRNLHLRFEPRNGMHVVARVRISMYEPRGEFQLIVEHMEEAGDGALRRAFDALKARLQTEGLFDAARKRPLPTMPGTVGVVTSPSGAAIRDVLTILRRRCPAVQVIVYPVAVQGAGAAQKIAAAIQRAGVRGECDVLIVGRGGGSLEDLWAFNEEVVARAIHASPIPVVSAVGHEIDFTIADFVADVRAATPSAAAELVSPDSAEQLKRLARLEARLTRCTHAVVVRKRQALTWMDKRLKHPGRRLQELAQRVDELQTRLIKGQQRWLRHTGARLTALTARLAQHTPLHRVVRLSDRRQDLTRRLGSAMVRLHDEKVQYLRANVRALHAVSPLATLGRGYAIVQREDGSVVRTPTEVAVGDRVRARLAQGALHVRIEEKETDA